MAYHRRLKALGGLAIACSVAGAAPAQMYWKSPDFSGAPATGDEAGLVQPLVGATPAESEANLMWTMRAGLNVAALQCQFAPALNTVDQYNDLIAHHAKELNAAYLALGAYFKRIDPKTAQTALDQFTTRTYNSFSTLRAQFSFCQVASRIGGDLLAQPKGGFARVARARMREFRNSLVPAGDRIWEMSLTGMPYPAAPTIDRYGPECYDKKGRVTKACLKIYG